MFDTPIVLLIFKRPQATQAVFDRIRQIQPKQLLVVADAPRLDRVGEAEKCAAARAVIEQVDWDCDVQINDAEMNLGCGKRISTGLDWVFEQVEEAIILEDDCIPDLSFFPFCQKLLARYREDTRIFSIAAQDFTRGRYADGTSYYFSRYAHSWGWATWRRAWQHYDYELELWKTLPQKQVLYNILQNARAVEFWHQAFQFILDGKLDTWDYQWLLCCWLNSGLSIHPRVNLVTNVGFTDDATHTAEHNRLANLPLEAIEFPLQHPQILIREVQSDAYLQRKVYDYDYVERAKLRLNWLLNKRFLSSSQ
ncbi:MAG: glycosyltransferase family 2 protein [Leptolyngbya sp. UWPOB_LEPTO1]|uniref:glycosyltransferase family 2 protein n=1 Tax=Leptolyngbya sp. UWPOB_LEPTO1 TaxID=2815653 RepID=UPI001AC91D16|nr:glycosyltransferase family 2 protein [Leptolyngbya sp. UWPOB_LEPTO1]MBN8560365.1 glycosyltransferase family 2 protein [Leptolyngbya sp. UWPOB_LEPTO1]